jgi:hypothetical protein
LRQHSEVTDLRELARPGAEYSNQEVDEAYLEAISRSFGGCQAIDVENGPMKPI